MCHTTVTGCLSVRGWAHSVPPNTQLAYLLFVFGDALPNLVALNNRLGVGLCEGGGRQGKVTGFKA